MLLLLYDDIYIIKISTILLLLLLLFIIYAVVIVVNVFLLRAALKSFENDLHFFCCLFENSRSVYIAVIIQLWDRNETTRSMGS